MQIDFYHMHLLTGIKIQVANPPPEGLDLTLSAMTPSRNWRELYRFDNDVFYPAANASYPSVR